MQYLDNYKRLYIMFYLPLTVDYLQTTISEAN